MSGVQRTGQGLWQPLLGVGRAKDGPGKPCKNSSSEILRWGEDEKRAPAAREMTGCSLWRLVPAFPFLIHLIPDFTPRQLGDPQGRVPAPSGSVCLCLEMRIAFPSRKD